MSTGNIGKVDFTKISWSRNTCKMPKTLYQITKKFLVQNNKESATFHRREMRYNQHIYRHGLILTSISYHS